MGGTARLRIWRVAKQDLRRALLSRYLSTGRGGRSSEAAMAAAFWMDVDALKLSAFAMCESEVARHDKISY